MVFKSFEQLKTHHQLIVALLIIVAVVSIWRAVWSLCDLYLFPSKPVLSYMISLAFGVIVIIGTHYTIKSGMNEIVG
jgi:hypothetical protein